MHALDGWLSRDLAIDLGTSTTRIHVAREGLRVAEPSVVALRRLPREPSLLVAVGAAAAEMIGRQPHDVTVVHPIKGGAIADFECTEALLRALTPRAPLRSRLLRPRVLVAAPSDLSGVERRALHEAALHAGARSVRIVPKVVAAAVGAGLDVGQASGNLVLDVGGGTTEVAVLSLSGVVCSRASRVGGGSLDDALVAYVKRKYNLLIGTRTAEAVKLEVGTAWPTDDMRTFEVRGRDLVTGVPKTVEVGSEEAREALLEPTNAIVRCLRDALECTPPELAGDIAERGIVMVGGGSLLSNLDWQLREATGLPAIVAEDPENAVARGAGRILEDPRLLASLTADAALPSLVY